MKAHDVITSYVTIAIVWATLVVGGIIIGPIRLGFFFAWYDFWVGAYFDRAKGVVYICPLPMCVFTVTPFANLK